MKSLTLSDSVDVADRCKTSVEIDKVRISPASLVFTNVHVGNSLKGKIFIANEGKAKAFIKILSPNIKDFVIEDIPQGMMMKPGLNLAKTVTIFQVAANCLHFTIPITVNNHKIDYEVIVLLSSSVISCSPTSIDFGMIDEGVISPYRTLTLSNQGQNITHFFVDTLKTTGHIIVEPNKGIIPARSNLEIKVKVIPVYSGKLHSSLVIKCDKNVTIPITATAIIPKLEALHPWSTKQFTLIYFSPTYFGLKSVQHLMIRNYSAADCMFTIDGEQDGQSMEFGELPQNNPDVNSFNISPLNGVMQPQETKLFWITFAPTIKAKKHFYFCTVIIQKIRCKYLQAQVIGTDLYPKVPETPYPRRCSLLSVSTTGSTSTHQTAEYEASFLTAAEALAYYRSQEFTEKDMVRIHICGKAEVPCVKIIPDELHLCNIRMQATETRVLELQNISDNLPIVLRYQKVPFIHLENGMISLKASESKQIAVTVVPCKLGNISTKMVFELMYCDQPKKEAPKVIGRVSVKVTLVVKSVASRPKPQINTGLSPNYISETGRNCHDLRFSSSFVNAKAITLGLKRCSSNNSNVLVALPNERSRSLRPWRSNVACCTIFTNQPRYVQPIDREYERTQSELDLRRSINSYYNKFIGGSVVTQKPTGLEDYAVTQQKKVLCADLVCAKVQTAPKQPVAIHNCLIPLTPSQMKKIRSMPECVRTGAIAANNNLIFSLRIQNANDFEVRLCIRSDKSNIGCVHGNRFTLKANSCIEVKLIYLSSTVGYYAAIIDLIFNESMMLSVPVIADVVPINLSLNETELKFDENCTRKYIEVTNSLNIPVKFLWLLKVKCFSIQPLEGVVEPRRTMLCVVNYLPEIEGPGDCTVKLISGECSTQCVTLRTAKFNRRLEMISKELNFENLPLQKACALFPIMKNPCSFPISFEIDRTNLPSWVDVIPMTAIVHANSQFSVTVLAICKKCVTFQGSIKIIILNSSKKIELIIRGNVIYPDIQINPITMNFQKVPSNTNATITFTLLNNCPVHTNVKFLMEQYEEFKITESKHCWDATVNGLIAFKPHEVKTFYIHFVPTEAASTWFYLPLLIDDILGPPLRYDAITQLVDYYLIDDKSLYDNTQHIPIPQKLPCAKIIALALEPKITFSKKKIIFQIERREKKKTYDLKIKNYQHTADVLHIKVSTLSKPFSYLSKDEGASMKEYNHILHLSIKPMEEKEITIIYEPTSFGKSKIFIPVYLQSEKCSKIYTVIEIEGIYNRPQINTLRCYVQLRGTSEKSTANKVMINTNDEYMIYPRALPESIHTFAIGKVVFKNHYKDCVVSYNFDGDPIMNLMANEERNWMNETDFTVNCRITNFGDSTCIYMGHLQISCTCGGIWTRPVIGAYENSFLTTYAFSQSYLREMLVMEAELQSKTSSPMISRCELMEYSLSGFWELFPLFSNTGSEFTEFMEGCVYAIEMWVSNQGFFQEVYYVIPSDMNDFYVKDIEDKKRKLQAVQQPDIPFIRLLYNMIGQKVYDYLAMEDVPVNEEERVYYLYSIFKKAMDLVKSHGGTFTYISAEFFLPYNYFEVYRRDFLETIQNGPMRALAEWTETIEEFHLLAKQSWLDLLLQTYKVFYLSRLAIERDEKATYAEPLNNFFEALPGITLKNTNIHSKSEQVIIAWCQYHFDQKLVELWSKENIQRKVVNIAGDSLSDGLVLVAITSTYCPYMAQTLQTVYLHPDTKEECVHNLLTVIKCWEALNYSFDITANELLKPNSVRILMLMAYLYDVMPSMFPSKTMCFKAGLSSTVTKSLKLSNRNDYPIAYKSIIIPQNTVFTVSHDKLVIPPQKTVELKIFYQAKFSKEFNCTLLLSGEVPKYHYARNKCLSLTGIPDITYASTVITHPAYIFEIVDLNLIIQSPYKGAGSYDLRQTADVLENHEDLEKLEIHTEKARFESGRIVITSDVFLTDNEGVLQVQGMIRTLLTRDVSSFLYFSNSEMGYFMVRIDTKWFDSNKSEDLHITLPAGYCEQPELYAERHRLTINIPFQHNMWWELIRNAVYKLTEGDDKTVWTDMFDLPEGKLIATRLPFLLKHFGSYMQNNQPQTYRLTTNKACNLLLPPEVTFLSEYQPGTLEIEWKPKSPHQLPNNFVMTLYNKPFAKLRRYNIIFLCNQK